MNADELRRLVAPADEALSREYSRRGRPVIADNKSAGSAWFHAKNRESVEVLSTVWLNISTTHKAR